MNKEKTRCIMYGDQEGRESLSRQNVRASRLKWTTLPLPVGWGKKDGWLSGVGIGHSVVEDPETHSNLVL